jgi:asparagine synthase (glutamine-hydrolysing)
MRYVERIPAGVRMNRFRRKWLYRKAVRSLVPAEIIDRPKRAFETPYDRWLRSALGVEVERLYQRGTALGDVLDPGAVGRLVAEHRSGRGDHKRLLFCLLEFGEWHRSFVEGAADAESPHAAGAPA